MAAVLFYKRLITLGGAEVLLGQHYAYLKACGEDVTVICFEEADLERIEIAPGDLKVVPGRGTAAQVRQLARILAVQRGASMFCHSGHIEFGVAARLAAVRYAVFLHQPTTMSFNESDKFALRYWPRYRAFARRNSMFDRLCKQRNEMSIFQHIYVNARSCVSQMVLRRADALFVLSKYAVREKAEIFGLKTICLAGAITPERVSALTSKPEVRSVFEPIELVSVSRIDENKRIETLLHAVAALKARGRTVRLRLGGKGRATDALKGLAIERDVADCVEFLGFVPEADIPALYESMDLFVTIDWADYRITTYEVLAENRRVIVSDDTDADPDLLGSGYFFVSAPDGEALADTIERALNTPVVWDRVRLAKYLLNFTWPVHFDQIGKALKAHAA